MHPPSVLRPAAGYAAFRKFLHAVFQRPNKSKEGERRKEEKSSPPTTSMRRSRLIFRELCSTADQRKGPRKSCCSYPSSKENAAAVRIRCPAGLRRLIRNKSKQDKGAAQPATGDPSGNYETDRCVPAREGQKRRLTKQLSRTVQLNFVSVLHQPEIS